MPSFKPLLAKAFEKNHLHFPSELIDKFELYLLQIQRWNRVFNLTAITEPEEMVYLHLIDSLSVQAVINGNSILDVGSGAGLPGIPLALSNPQKSFSLIDKSSKKTRFLRQMISELALENVSVIHARCEDFHPEVLFDSIIARAFSSLRTFLLSTKHLLSKNGQFIAMKARYPDQEIKDLPPGFRVVNVSSVEINGLKIERNIVLLKLD